VWVTARFGILFKLLYVTKTINIFLVHFRFLKKQKIFLMLLGIMRTAPFLPKSPLIYSYQQQNIWPKITVVFFTKWFQSLLLVGGGCVLSISPCWPLPTYPHRVVKGTHFEAWTPPDPEPGSSPTYSFEARFRLENQIYQGSQDMRNCGVTKNVVCRCSCRYTVYHTENSSHLDQNIGLKKYTTMTI